MKWFTVKKIFLLTVALFVNYSLSESAPNKTSEIKKVMDSFPQKMVTRITIVGDTGQCLGGTAKNRKNHALG